MPADRDDAGSSFPPVRVVSGGAFELVAQLSAFTSGPARASLESGKPWIRDVRGLAGPELIRRVEAFALPVYASLAAFALETPEPHDPDQLVERLGAAPPELVRRHVSGAEAPSNRSMVSDAAFERALEGDAAAQAELRRDLGLSPSSRRSLDRVLALPPAALREEVVAILDAWARQVYPAFADTSLAVIARDAATKQLLLDAGAPRDLVRAALNGVDPGEAWGATELVVVPTVAMRPFVIPVDVGTTVIYVCSVPDEALDDEPGAPPRRLVKIAFAMGDPLRLRILRTLASDELTASEIAERLGIDRTTLHHHLGILRSAGLLSIRDEGVAGWRYARRTDGVEEATRVLLSFLSEPGGG